MLRSDEIIAGGNAAYSREIWEIAFRQDTADELDELVAQIFDSA